MMPKTVNGHAALALDAVENVHWGAGWANLCARHANQVKRSACRQRRTEESIEPEGQQMLPEIAS
jgi:hypothetical protein